MRILKIFLLAIALLFSLPAFGATVYIAQNAGTFSGGTACNGQIAVTPALVTWTAGNTYYICGTITGANGVAVVTVGANGSVGNLITILFDTGAILQDGYCGNNGCLNLNSHTFVTVNGQNTGTIQATTNGTNGGSGCVAGTCTTQQPSIGIANFGSNTTVKNLTVSNMYVDSSNSDTTGPGINYTNCLEVALQQTPSNVIVSGNTIHDCLTGVEFWWNSNGGSNYQLANNTIYNNCWGMDVIQGGNGNTYTNTYIYGNHVYNHKNWSASNQSCHGNAIHIFQASACTTCVNANFYLYNNEFDGPANTADTTSQIYTDQNGANTTITGLYVFNNILSWANGDCAGTCDALFAHADGYNSVVDNNTFIGNATVPGTLQNECFQLYVLTGTVSQNNLSTGCQTLIEGKSGGTWTTLNHNLYANSDGNAFIWQGSFLSNAQFATWKTDSGEGTGSAYQSSSPIANCNSSTDCSNVTPSGGSSAIGFGANLYTFAGCSSPVIPGLGALCFDKAGATRPSGGAWDAGALCSTTTCSGGGGGTVATPTFSPVAGGYTAAQTVTLATTTPSAVLCFTTDGTTPTETAHLCSGGTTQTYSTPITVGTSETVKVLGTLSGFTDSVIATGNYFIGTAPSPAMFASVAVQ